MTDRESSIRLTTPEAAEALVRELRAGGLVSAKVLEKILRETTETRDAARAVVEAEERAPKKRVSFAKAAQFLGKSPLIIGGNECRGLEAARVQAVKEHKMWGYIEALKKRGAVTTNNQYGALFDKATVNETDLHKVREMIERGEKVLPIFDAGKMIPDELFAVLFTEGGVPHSIANSGLTNLARLRRIDPKDIPDLANLAGKSCDEQLAAFRAACEEADPLEPTGPRVIFTPDQREVTRTGTSAIQDIQAFKKGEMAFIDPNADMIRFRTQMDAGLRKIARGRANFDGLTPKAYRAFLDKAFRARTIGKYMPDREKTTRYPNYAYENSGVLGLYFGPDDCLVHVIYCYPGYPRYPGDDYDDLGGRLSLG